MCNSICAFKYSKEIFFDSTNSDSNGRPIEISYQNFSNRKLFDNFVPATEKRELSIKEIFFDQWYFVLLHHFYVLSELIFLKISNKSTPNDFQFLDNVEKPHSNVKTAVDTFWATFGNISATFYSNIWSHWEGL